MVKLCVWMLCLCNDDGDVIMNGMNRMRWGLYKRDINIKIISISIKIKAMCNMHIKITTIIENNNNWKHNTQHTHTYTLRWYSERADHIKRAYMSVKNTLNDVFKPIFIVIIIILLYERTGEKQEGVSVVGWCTYPHLITTTTQRIKYTHTHTHTHIPTHTHTHVYIYI